MDTRMTMVERQRECEKMIRKKRERLPSFHDKPLPLLLFSLASLAPVSQRSSLLVDAGISKADLSCSLSLVAALSSHPLVLRSSFLRSCVLLPLARFPFTHHLFPSNFPYSPTFPHFSFFLLSLLPLLFLPLTHAFHCFFFSRGSSRARS